MKTVSTPRVICKAYDPIGKVIYTEGTDFGAPGRVILRKGEARVVWRSGSTGWSGIGMRAYYKAVLQIENLMEKGHRRTVQLSEGGRLSQVIWEGVRKRVAELFKLPLKKIPAELPDRTVNV